MKEAIDMETNEKVALKIFKKNQMNVHGLNAAYFEHSMMKKLQHKNILACRGYFEDSDYLILVLDILSSDLRALLVELNAPMNETQIK